MKSHTPATLYGPVRSWRFGRSLGLDPICHGSVCSFNCIYCQLGAIQETTCERREFIPTQWVADELKNVDPGALDVVTISGSGEPTLAANLGEMVAAIRRALTTRVVVLTNASLLHRKDVRRDLRDVDEVDGKLDAPNEALWRRINRPAEGVAWPQIVEGLAALRDERPDQRLTLQIMLMPMNVDALAEWPPLIRHIRPDRVFLNAPRRPYPDRWRLTSRGRHNAVAGREGYRALRTLTPGQMAEAQAFLQRETDCEVTSRPQQETL